MSDHGRATRRLDERRLVVSQSSSAPESRRAAPFRAGVNRIDDAAAVAGYIADMTAQLESMAKAAGLELVAYFLAMARAESRAPARGGASADCDRTPPDEM